MYCAFSASTNPVPSSRQFIQPPFSTHDRLVRMPSNNDSSVHVVTAPLTQMVVGRKKLLVLHLKGFLIDCYHEREQRPKRRPDAKVNKTYVYRRPGCEEFVKFCLDNFVVGVWSSAYEHNVLALADFTFGKERRNLAFIWHKDHGTDSRRMHPDNRFKPLIWKELSKLWNKDLPELPWKKGDFGPSNTVLIDDDPFTIHKNPQNTAIILETYRVTEPDDNYLGKLRKYLKGVIVAEDVQEYLKKPFNSSSLSNDDLPLELLNSLTVKGSTGMSGAGPSRSIQHPDETNPQLVSYRVNSKEARQLMKEKVILQDIDSSKDGADNTPKKPLSTQSTEPHLPKGNSNSDGKDPKRIEDTHTKCQLVPANKELQPSDKLSIKDENESTTEASASLSKE